MGRYTSPPEQCTLGDTGNKRAVRILLDCILVVHSALVNKLTFRFLKTFSDFTLDLPDITDFARN